MKINKLSIILIIIILLLVGYIAYDKLYEPKEIAKEEDALKIVDTIKFDYVNIYLLSDGVSYIVPLKTDEISRLDATSSLKERLNTIYTQAIYFDIFINNYKLKGFRVKLDSDIKKMYKVDTKYNTYVIFLKENNTIGLFNYEEYYDLLNTNVIDNYQDLNNVFEIKNNKVIHLDGSSEVIDFKE